MAPCSWLAFGLLALAQTVQSAVLDLPTPTSPGIHKERADINGWSPKPTGDSAQHLFKRVIATARTCGWAYYSTDRSSSAIACGAGSTCVSYSSSGLYVQGCCASGYSGCDFATTCIGYTSVARGTSSNPLALYCTNSAEQYCQTYYFAGKGVSGYGCDSTSTSGTKYVYSTYSLPSASSTTTAYMSYVPRSALPAEYLSSVSGRSSAYATATSTSRTTSSSSRYYSNTSTGVSTGAIIIIVVIIVIWALYYVGACVIVFFMCRRSKKNVADWKAKGMTGVHGVAGLPHGVTVAPYYANPSNVVSPPAPVYYQQNGAVPAAGDHASGFYGQATENKVSPMQGTAYPAPGHQSQQPSPPAPQASQPAPAAATGPMELSAAQSPPPVQAAQPQPPAPQAAGPAPVQRPAGSNALHEIG